MWLTHHWPEHHDRCLHAGSVLVCRRCAVLYPLAIATAALVLWTNPPEVAAVVAMWLLPLPMTLEWVAEHRGEIEHSPRRLVWLSAFAAIGVGAALAAHLRQPFDPDALAPMATHATICGVAALRATRPSTGRDALGGPGRTSAVVPAWEREHDAGEAERQARLRRLLDEPGRGSTPTE
jgi:hypothetical protein